VVATGSAVLFRLGVAGPISVARPGECGEAIHGRAAAGLRADLGIPGVPLPIFTQNVIAPIFFEIIQPKGSELDQMRRGVL